MKTCQRCGTNIADEVTACPECSGCFCSTEPLGELLTELTAEIGGKLDSLLDEAQTIRRKLNDIEYHLSSIDSNTS